MRLEHGQKSGAVFVDFIHSVNRTRATTNMAMKIDRLILLSAEGFFVAQVLTEDGDRSMQRKPVSNCTHCGADLQEDDRFCGHCGTPVVDETEKEQMFDTSARDADARERKADSSRPPPEAPDAAGDTTETDFISASPAKPKRRRGRKLFIALAMLLMITAGLLALTHFYIIDLDQGLVSELIQLLQPKTKGNIIPTQQPGHSKNRIPTLADYKRDIKKALARKDYPRMNEYLQAGLRHYPQDPDLLTSQALYFLKCNQCGSREFRTKAALNAASRALEISPTDGNYINVGWIYQELAEDCRAALYYYKKGIGWGRGHPSLFYVMGICYQKEGYWTLAKDHYRRYLKAVPKGEKAADARRRLSR